MTRTVNISPDPVPPLSSPHATILLDAHASDLDELRRRWDPVMASQIGAHVTVAYPHEVPDLAVMIDRVRSAALTTPSFTLQLGSVVHDGDPRNGIFVEVDDTDAGWARLRSLIAGRAADEAIRPHLTLVHPRTSALGSAAWNALRDLDCRRTIDVMAVAVTAFDGDRWLTVTKHDLT
jgi:hypothetical protein